MIGEGSPQGCLTWNETTPPTKNLGFVALDTKDRQNATQFVIPGLAVPEIKNSSFHGNHFLNQFLLGGHLLAPRCVKRLVRGFRFQSINGSLCRALV